MTENTLKEIKEIAKDGFYSKHLTEISDNGNQVRTTEDVVNDKGILLVPKGMSIDSNVRDKLLKHKLLKPLHFHVGLESTLTASQLFEKFNLVQEEYPDIKSINEALQFTDQFDEIFKANIIPPIVLQKMTVMESQLPDEFQKALFCTWFATLSARELGVGNEAIINTFLSALIHDVGLLHLDPDITKSNRQLNHNEWRMIQSHVIIGKIIADAIPELHSDVSRAIIEHHETCYGSGYPLALSGKERALPGRILGMSDSIHAIYIKQDKSQRTLANAIPYLQLNSSTQSQQVYRVALSIIKNSRLKPVVFLPKDSIQLYAQYLSDKTEVMQKLKSSMEIMNKDMNNFLSDKNKDKHLTTLHAILNRMLHTFKESGLLSVELLNWMKSIAIDGDESTLTVLNEIDSLTEELSWQLRNTMRMHESYYEKVNSKNPALANSIKYLATVIELSLTELYKIKNSD